MENKVTGDYFNELVLFIRDQIREYKMPITRDTLIEDDLGVTGDEANELLINFSRKYNVNISNFNFSKYFYDEPGVFNIQNRKIEPFTVGHLEKAIMVGCLDEKVINS